METLKSFTLKLLYFAVGILPVIIIVIGSKQALEKKPATLLWFGLFVLAIIAAILIQKKLRKMGVLNLKEAGTYLALLIIAAIAFILTRQIV